MGTARSQLDTLGENPLLGPAVGGGTRARTTVGEPGRPLGKEAGISEACTCSGQVAWMYGAERCVCTSWYYCACLLGPVEDPALLWGGVDGNRACTCVPHTKVPKYRRALRIDTVCTCH